MKDIADLPEVLVGRLRHYFETNKPVSDSPAQGSVDHVYGPDHALKVVRAAMEDYNEEFGGLDPGVERCR